ncbi:MAG: hypothetical protein DRJ67_05415 [Thermoprotei archaeon]|nr:MAG: hypothetical protein DRJ67_05415 [Thermoprotei archaeon]
MSSDEYLKSIKARMGLFEKIISYIPGYRGYKEKELRRESDKLIRMAVADRLKDAKHIVKISLASPSIIERLSSKDLWEVQSLLAKLDRLAQRISRAVAGYAGLFDIAKVKEDKLEMIMMCDYRMISIAEKIRSEALSLLSLKVGSENWRKELDKIAKLLDRLDSEIDKRYEILRRMTERI